MSKFSVFYIFCTFKCGDQTKYWMSSLWAKEVVETRDQTIKQLWKCWGLTLHVGSEPAQTEKWERQWFSSCHWSKWVDMFKFSIRCNILNVHELYGSASFVCFLHSLCPERDQFSLRRTWPGLCPWPIWTDHLILSLSEAHLVPKSVQVDIDFIQTMVSIFSPQHMLQISL